MRIIPGSDHKVIKVLFPLGETCNGSHNYSLTADLYFNDTKGVMYFDKMNLLEQIQNKSCDLKIDMYTNKKFIIENYYAGYHFFLQYYYILGPLMIIAGLFFILIGAKKEGLSGIIGFSLALALFLFSFIFSFFITIKIQKVNPSDLNVFIVILSGLIGGAIFGFLAWKLKKIIVISILTTGFGYLIGIFLFNLGLRYLTDNVDTIFWMTVIIFSIGGALLPFYIVQYKKLTILSTAVIGGYLISRGIAVLFREKSGFTSENIIFDLSTRGEFLMVKKYRSPKVYIFLGIWVVISGASFFLQSVINFEKTDNDYAPLEQ